MKTKKHEKTNNKNYETREKARKKHEKNRKGTGIAGRDSNLRASLYVADNREETSYLSSLDLSMFHQQTKPNSVTHTPTTITDRRPHAESGVEIISPSGNME